MAETWVMGGYKTDTLTGKVQKIGSCTGTTLSNSGQVFSVLGASYQVTAGKTFYITGIIWLKGDVAVNLAHIRYADNAALTTNPVAIGINAPTMAYTTPIPMISIAGLSAPAGKYVGIFDTSASSITVSVIIIGYEV